MLFCIGSMYPRKIFCEATKVHHERQCWDWFLLIASRSSCRLRTCLPAGPEVCRLAGQVRVCCPEMRVVIAQCALGRFIFHRNQLSRFSELIPCHGIWITKTMPFFSHKNCFFGSRTRDEILKILLGSLKNIFKIYLYWGLKDSSWWGNSKYGLRIESGWYLTPILAEQSLKSHWNRDPGLFLRFFGQNMCQILSKLNSVTIFGILLSRRTF